MNLSSTQKAPNPNLVIVHFVIGGISFVVFTAILMFNPSILLQHYFNPILLSATHLLVLGFITMICFGALYQLLPVILDVKLHSEKMGWATLFFLTFGFLLLIISFWNFNFGFLFYISATSILIAITIFKINLLLTAKKDQQKSIQKQFIITAVIWLFFTVIAGLLFGINLSNSFIPISHLELLKLHAHIGIFGWFIQLIMGVGSKLFPMFLLSYEADKKPLKIAFVSINLGLLIGVFSLFFAFNFGIISAIILVAFAIVNFLRFIYETYTKRVKRTIDIGMKKSVVAVLFLLIPLVTIFIIILLPSSLLEINTSLSLLYGFALLIGFISMLIMGLTYKTLPFIIWLKIYKVHVGKNKIPMPKDLYSEKIQKYQFIIFIFSFWMLIIGILLSKQFIVQTGTILLFTASILYLINLLKIVLHKSKIT